MLSNQNRDDYFYDPSKDRICVTTTLFHLEIVAVTQKLRDRFRNEPALAERVTTELVRALNSIESSII